MTYELVIIGLLILTIFLIFFRTGRTLESKDISDIGSIKTRLDDFKTLFDKNRDAVEEIKATMNFEKEIREKEQTAITQIQRILTDTSQRGRTGEAIIGEVLKHFPPNMIERNFRIESDVVEFGLKFIDGKVMPIDSKFRATELVERLDGIEDIKKRREIIKQIDNSVLKHVSEVGKKYIDPKKTLTFAVAAVPDSVYAICTKAHARAYKHGVVLMPYSMTVPYLLTLYELRIQYSKSMDIERVENALTAMETELRNVDDVMTNRVYHGLKMVRNGVDKFGEIIVRVKSHIALAKEPTETQLESEEFLELPEGKEEKLKAS